MFGKSKKHLLLGGLVFLWLLSIPGTAAAETDIKLTICDPDRPYIPGQQQEGNTDYTVLSSPQVSYGENRELGTVRAAGKPGIAVPVKPGQKVKIILPVGISYMQIPNEENYRNYVEWPAAINGQENQLADQNGKPGMKFVAGTPRTLTLQVESLNPAAPVMALDFIFNKDNYSRVRVAPILEDMDQYNADADGKLSRLEFFKMLMDVNTPFSSSPLFSVQSVPEWEARFTDIKNLSAADLGKISPLLEGGFVNGYPGGQLAVNQTISRAEAVALAGKIFASSRKKASFKDPVPDWAAAGIDSAVSGGLAVGYPDGSFQANRYLSKGEALSLIQNCLESYCYQQ